MHCTSIVSTRHDSRTHGPRSSRADSCFDSPAATIPALPGQGLYGVAPGSPLTGLRATLSALDFHNACAAACYGDYAAEPDFPAIEGFKP